MRQSDFNVKLIAIAGGTASGKTTIACKIAKLLKKQNVVYLNMDSYYKKVDNLPLEERRKINYDHPDSIDVELLVKHINALKNYQSIEKPIYDFSINQRTEKTVTVMPADVIMLDGILTLAIDEILALSDIKIFVETEADIRFIRRLTRDVRERGRTIDSVIHQYLATVKPMHEFFVEPSIKKADIIVPFYDGNDIAVDMIATKIKDLLKRD